MVRPAMATAIVFSDICVFLSKLANCEQSVRKLQPHSENVEILPDLHR